MTHRVLVADPISEAGLARLRGGAEVIVRTGLDKQELLALIGEVDAVVTRSETRITREVLETSPHLRVVGRAGVGVDNIDVEAATERGVLVVNVPTGNTVAAAEHTLAMMLTLARQIPAADADLRSGQWRRGRFTGVELKGKTLGLIGLGRIGAEVAQRARAFGMQVAANDPYVSPARAEMLGVRLIPLEDVLAESDFVSLHVAKTPDTVGLLGSSRLALMKPGARLVNCARGGLVDEMALYEALQSGRLAGAALDVFSQEPITHHPLFALHNVVVTPHLAGSTAEALEANGVLIAEAVLDALAGQPVATAVNWPSLSPLEAAAIQPFLPLAEALGRIYAQAEPGPMEQVEVSYEGGLAGLATGPLTNFVLKGLLGPVLDEPVNQVNARVVAARRGVRVEERRSQECPERPHQLTVRVRSRGRAGSIAGYLSAGGPRVLAINDLEIDFTPSRYMLVTRHQDRPGMIGRVGTLLGQHDINIAAMQVGRSAPRGEAVMVLQVDDLVPDPILAELSGMEGMGVVRRVVL